jgi:hypothetical protein
VGNLGGGFGTYVLGWVKKATGSFQNGILFLAASMAISATILLLLGIGHRAEKPRPAPEVDPLAEALHEPV